MDLCNDRPFSELPSRHDVIEFLKELRKDLYPGYFEKIDGDINTYLAYLHNRLYQMFLDTIYDCKEAADIFFEKLEEVKMVLKTDIEMTFLSDPACESEAEIILTYPGIFAISTYRVSHILDELKIPIIPRIMTEYAHSKTGIDIHPGASIGEYFFIDHGTGIVIGETAVIGHHVKIYHGVTLGALSLKKGQSLRGLKRHPTIGNYVTIYSGASVLGGETVVGDNSTLGCNVFLVKSVKENSKVMIKVEITENE